MIPIDVNRAIDQIEGNFFYDVTKATVALFYLLQGMEVASHVFGQNPVDQRKPQLSVEGPRLTRLKTFPAVSTTGTAMLGPSGEAVQLAFKGWVADICGKWARSRSKTRDRVGEKGICVEVECMGDFNHIRNDLLHSGLATKDHSGKCKVLSWFKPGERIVFTTDHVFDFLNQMDFLRPPLVIADSEGRRGISWTLVPDAAQLTSLEQEGVRIVSFRCEVDNDDPEGAQRYMLSTVFNDGVFGQGPVEVPVAPEQYYKGSLDKDGNIAFPDGQVLFAENLYEACYGYLDGDRKIGPGIMGPDARYVKDSERQA